MGQREIGPGGCGVCQFVNLDLELEVWVLDLHSLNIPATQLQPKLGAAAGLAGGVVA